MNDNEIIKKLDNWMSTKKDERFDFESSNCEYIGKFVPIYIFDLYGFKVYCNDLYDSMKIKQFGISKKKFKEILLDDYTKQYISTHWQFDIIQELKQIKLQDYHVLLPIYNIHINTNQLMIGKYRIIQYQQIGTLVTAFNNFSNKSSILQNDQNLIYTPYVEIVIKARDWDLAYEQAQIKLEEIIQVLNFILYSNIRGAEVLSSVTNIGAHERKFIYTDQGYYTKTEGYLNIKRPTLDSLYKYILSDEYGFKKLWKIFDMPTNEIHNRILNAVRWTGMAIAEKNNSVAFTQATFAIESLLQRDIKGELFTKSTVASIAEEIAFLLGNSCSERKEIEKDFKKYYSIRSKIAHGKSINKEISNYDVLKIIDFAKSIILQLLTNQKFAEWKNMNDMQNYIIEQRYTVGAE